MVESDETKPQQRLTLRHRAAGRGVIETMGPLRLGLTPTAALLYRRSAAMVESDETKPQQRPSPRHRAVGRGVIETMGLLRLGLTPTAALLYRRATSGCLQMAGGKRAWAMAINSDK